MPTTLSTFATGEATMRYKEPYVTEGLNKKLAVTVPAGIYRGFRLSTSGSNLSVTVVADATESDHVAGYRTQGGFALTIRKTGGDFTLDLSAFASKTVVICIYCTYGVGFTTTAEIRGYEFSPSDTFTGAAENSELVVLGTVVVPAAGLISSASIVHDRRRMAWENGAVEAIPWSPILKNPSFEHGISNDTTRFAVSDWTHRQTGEVNGSFRIAGTTVRSGAKSLEFNKTAVGASVARFEQYQEVPVTPGQLIRVVGYVRQLIAPTAGSYTFNLYWGDLDSVATTSAVVTASASGTDASFRKVEAVIAVPASTYVLKSFTIEVVNVTTGSTGVSVVFDDVQVYVETGSALTRPSAHANNLRQVITGAMVLEDTSTYQLGQLAALLRFDKSTPASEGSAILERRDQVAGSLPPALSLVGRILNLGANLLGSEANALKPRISAPITGSGSFEFTLLWESVAGGGSSAAVRFYAGWNNGQPGLFITVNAFFDGTNWNKDDTTRTSTGIYASVSVGAGGVFEVYQRPAGAGTWIMSGWSDELAYSADGVLNMSHLVAGAETSLAYFGRLHLGVVAAQVAKTNNLLGVDLGYERRAVVAALGDGDVSGLSVIDQHGRVFDHAHVFQDDFNVGPTLPDRWVQQDIAGVGSVSMTSSAGRGFVDIQSGATSGNQTIIRNYGNPYWDTGGAGVGVGFRARLRATAVSAHEQRFGFWDNSSFNPDNDNALNGFKIVNGAVSVVWTDSGGLHVVSTGVTVGAGDSRWYSWAWNPVNGILQWHVSTAGAEFGDYGTTYGEQPGVDDPILSGQAYLFAGCKTNTASVSRMFLDYLCGWRLNRFAL